MKPLEGKVVVVTGAGRGIGRGIALRVAAEGASVVVADFGGALDRIEGSAAAPAQAVAEEIRAAGGLAEASAQNIATLDGADRAIDTALKAYGRLDGLVCAAGLYVHKPIWETSEQEWDDVIASHLKGHFACTRAATRVMMKQRSGSIVYFSSSAALSGSQEASAYVAAKAGVLGLARNAALGLKAHGVRVNCVLPGAATRMTDKINRERGVATDDANDMRRNAAGRPASSGLRSELAAGTWRDPANVGPFVAYLLSDRAERISGHAFAVVGYQVTHVRERSFGKTIRSERTWDFETLGRRFEAELAPDLQLTQFVWPPP